MRRRLGVLAAGLSTLGLLGSATAQGRVAPTVSPLPGTLDASPTTQISVLGVTPRSLAAISVAGSLSGTHQGHWQPYRGDRGASFLSDRPFSPSERVAVRVRLTNGSRLGTVFRVGAPVELTVRPITPQPVFSGSRVWSFASRPDLHPARIQVRHLAHGVARGDILLAPFRAPLSPLQDGQAGPMIIDNHANPVWFRPVPTHDVVWNLRAGRYGGSPVLSWWQGTLYGIGPLTGEDIVVDRSYREIARIRAGNGYSTDGHDLVLTSASTAFVLAYAPVHADLRPWRGPENGVLLDSVLQEIDVHTGLVMFEWHALGHIEPGESYVRPTAYGATGTSDAPFDPFHVNSVAVLGDGSLLLSMRNTWAAYDVSARTGRILWRLGGKRSSFRLGPGARFAWQHDVRTEPRGLISLFDNEAAPEESDQSRAIVLRLNMRRRTAALVRQYIHQPPVLAPNEGGLQVLGNGDAFVTWGSKPFFSEYSPGGRLLFDAHLPVRDATYRAVRAQWSGHPTQPPALALSGVPGAPGTAYVSWNGATDVARWQLLAGATSVSMKPTASARWAGFETALAVPASASYVAVRALSRGGRVLGATATLRR